MKLFRIGKKEEKKIVGSTSRVAAHSEKNLTVKSITLHPDLQNLGWIADGRFKNYIQNEDRSHSYDLGGIIISISYMNQEEPSLIYTKQKVSQPKNIEQVERPPYFPTYSGLTPEQKWVYLYLLSNPYNSSIDIGFVFILYYGLERHLLSGNFEKAFDVILKLRDAHPNKSFQAYSGNALVLCCILHNRGDLIPKFIQSLDKEYEFHFSHNLFLLCYYSFKFPISPKDIIRMAKTFEFTNLNYIKKYPDLFLYKLTEEIINNLGSQEIFLHQYITETEFKKLRREEVNIFANMSIRDKSIQVPLISEHFKMKKAFNTFLENTHERVKKHLAEMRKAGKTVPVKSRSPKTSRKMVFDAKREKSLLSALAQEDTNPVDRHFLYLNLQDLYYKYRDLDKAYLSKCIKYCILDINSLSKMRKAYIAEEIRRIKQMSLVYNAESMAKEVARIKKEGFIGSIPAFKRLVIIYEKAGEYDKALQICDLAIKYRESPEEFEKRKIKILKLRN